MTAKRLRLALGVAVFVLPTVAQAEPDRKACLEAVDEGQKLRDDGKLADAKKQFLTCAAQSCGVAVSKQCREWYEAASSDQPTVLFRAVDANGKELVDVNVIVDGVKVTDTIGGQSLPLDPGAHIFNFDTAGGAQHVEARFVVRVGEKNRLIEAHFPPVPVPGAPPPPPPPVLIEPPPEPRKFHVPTLAFVGGAVFVAGAATTVIFAVVAHSKETDLRGSCAPHCTEDDRDGVKSKLVIANVGMFVGLAGLGLAAVTTVLANRHGDQKRQETAASGVHIVAGPTGFGGTF